ncbi:MAG: sensor histidine kinase [Wujia sp.]
MDNQPKNNIEIIQSANKEMLDYFNTTFLHDLETIQDLKTQAFEIDIKIDELEKTKDLYAFKSHSKKSVFSPIISDGTEQERGMIIDTQIKDLQDIRETLYTKIRSMEHDLTSLKHRLAVLTDAEQAIREIADTCIKPAQIQDIDTTEDSDSEGFEFIEDTSENTAGAHGYNILMQDAFDRAYLSTLIDKNIKDNLISMRHKIDMLSYLLTTDISRARLTLQEILLSSKKTLDSVDEICDKLNYHIDSSKPVWNCLDEFIIAQREAHPEILIDTNLECVDYDVNLHPVFTITLIRLLDMFFDNVFRHANAHSIELRISITPNIIDVYIKDNGVGISDNYLMQSPWYSSLHKAHEIIYLLNGKLTISGEPMSGTIVRFSFPVQQ